MESQLSRLCQNKRTHCPSKLWLRYAKSQSHKIIFNVILLQNFGTKFQLNFLDQRTNSLKIIPFRSAKTLGRPNNTNKRSFESLKISSQDNAGAGHLVESWTRRSQFLRGSRAPPGPCKGCGKTFPRRPSSSARWPRLTRTSSRSGSGRLRSRWPRSAARLKKKQIQLIVLSPLASNYFCIPVKPSH